MKTVKNFLWNFISEAAVITVCAYCLIDLYYHSNISLENPYYMKPHSYILTCIIAVATMIVLITCNIDTRRPTTEYALLIDETDSTFTVPDSADVFTDLGIDTNMWCGINFSIARIVDVSYVPHSFVSIGKAPSRLAANKYARQREVQTFKAKIEAMLDSARNDVTGKPRSSIYLPIVDELVRLVNSKADRKTLTIFSDMRENTPDVSFYDPHTQATLAVDPDKIKTKFLVEAKLPDLTGIEIRIVYSPKNTQDDISFRLASGFFKKMLEEKGANVSISANLTNQ